MKPCIYFLLAFICSGVLFSCAGGNLFLKDPADAIQDCGTSTPLHTIYITGDAGEINPQSKSVLQQLAKMAGNSHHPNTLLFVGDNVYPAGVPPESDVEGYLHSKEILKNQVEPFHDFNGAIIFLPGNHDWNEFKPGGLDAIRRQGNFLRELNDPRVRMLPENGCGGPVTIELTDNIVLLIIDSQWWLQDWDNEPEMNNGCTTTSREQLVRSVMDIANEHAGKQLVVAMHHPLYSQGTHGGHFTVRDHLFPLSKVVKWLYLPLPVIGSIYPYYRSVIGHPQDVTHKNYTALKRSILEAVHDRGEIIFVAGHDHNMQYIVKEDDHFLLSGAGSKLNGIANTKDLLYGHKAPGFMRLDFFAERKVGLSIFEIDVENNSVDTVFSRFIIEKQNN